MKDISALLKGVITAVIMLILTLLIYYSNLPPESGFGLILYGVYAGGIIWTIVSYSKSPEYTGKFVDIFGQGFRCFIIATLMMVTFTGVFSMLHPEFAEKAATRYKEELVAKEKSKTPAEIDEMIALAKKHYTTSLIYSSVFGYLLLGTLFTAAGAGGLIIIKRKQ